MAEPGRYRRNGRRRPGGAERIAICVPVRNEAERLPRLLAAVDALSVPGGMSLDLCVLLDGCTDDSAAIVDAHRARTPHRIHSAAAAPAAPNAGRARHGAMGVGLDALGDGGGILLTTDADSWPRADWLHAMVDALGHAELVAGGVHRTAHHASGEQDRVDRYYDRLHALRRTIDPVPWESCATHHHVSGANMGLAAHVYRQLGGFLPLVSGEDARLADDAARAGLRVRRDAASVVQTSARRHGRAQNGLADALHDLDRHGVASIHVAHPADQTWQYARHRLARRAFAGGCLAALAEAVGLGHDHIVGVARDCPNGEAFAMRIVPVPPGGMRQIAFPAAEALLAAIASPAVAAA